MTGRRGNLSLGLVALTVGLLACQTPGPIVTRASIPVDAAKVADVHAPRGAMAVRFGVKWPALAGRQTQVIPEGTNVVTFRVVGQDVNRTVTVSRADGTDTAQTTFFLFPGRYQLTVNCLRRLGGQDTLLAVHEGEFGVAMEKPVRVTINPVVLPTKSPDPVPSPTNIRSSTSEPTQFVIPSTPASSPYQSPANYATTAPSPYPYASPISNLIDSYNKITYLSTFSAVVTPFVAYNHNSGIDITNPSQVSWQYLCGIEKGATASIECTGQTAARKSQFPWFVYYACDPDGNIIQGTRLQNGPGDIDTRHNGHVVLFKMEYIDGTSEVVGAGSNFGFESKRSGKLFAIINQFLNLSGDISIEGSISASGSIFSSR